MIELNSNLRQMFFGEIENQIKQSALEIILPDFYDRQSVYQLKVLLTRMEMKKKSLRGILEFKMFK